MFKPPISIVNKIKENKNKKIIEHETQQAANEMYKRDPVVQHNMTEHFSNYYDTRTTGLVSNKDTEQLWEQPFEPIIGHTGLNMYPEAEAEVFQRKLEMFTGNEKNTFFSQKEAVANDPYLMAPEPILNTSVPNPHERIDFFKQGLLRQGNVKPFESELVGARHIQPIFRPLPKTGAERSVNPKKTLEYQTTSPPVSNVPKGTLASQTFKNKVERAFAMDRLGFTTTGAVTKPSQYGQINNKLQNRPDTAPTKEQIFRNAGTETPLQQKPADNYSVNTSKESVQQPHVGNANLFNQTSLHMKTPENYTVNTSKEPLQHEYIGNTSPFNNQTLYMQGAENYIVNTSKEPLQHEYIGNTTPFNNQTLHMQGAENYSVNTSKEPLQHEYIGNTTPFNNQTLHMQGAENYIVNTSKEPLQHEYIGNTTPFNNQTLHMQGAENYSVNTAKEGLQHEYIGNTTPFNNQTLHMQGADNYSVNTAKEGLQHKYVGNASSFNNQALHMKSAENYHVNTDKEPLQHKYVGNASTFNNQALHMKSAENYHVNTDKEPLQHKYVGNAGPFNSQALYMKSAENYHVNTDKEPLQHKYIGNASSFNNQALHMKGAENYHVNTEKEDVMQVNHTGNAAPFNDVEAQAAPLGAAHFISKDEVLRGRKPTMCGPNITNVDVNVAFNRRKQLNGVREFMNGGTTSTERLTSTYRNKNNEIDLTERLDPCLNIPMLDNPYANALMY